MGKVIGIDLGTTNCCICVAENGKGQVIPNREGSRTTPSVVGFVDEGEPLVGQVARRQALANPKNTIFAVKRLIGKKFDSPDIKKALEQLPFEVVPSPNNDAWVKVNDREYSPQEISSMILRDLKDSAEQYLGEEIKEAIITVPAYFDDAQRQATRDSGKIAGFDVQRIINEPTAAALAYGMEHDFDGKIAVYDMGGGTFDVSILEVSDGAFEVLSTSGDTFLGGEDFDNAILDWLVAQFQEETGINLKFDKMAIQRIKEAAEKAKCELSSVTESEISLPFISSDESGAKHLNQTLTREKFEELITPLIERSKAPCQDAIKSAGLDPSQVDRVLLVGGQTRTPLIHKAVKDIFGKEPTMDLNPDEAVGMGASMQGAIMQGDVTDIVLLDVTPLSLGIETKGGLTYRMIDKNASIPTSFSQIFTTVEDNQKKVGVHILQGESELSSNNKSLARFELVDLPMAPKGIPQIEVTFSIDTNGIVKVSAVDMDSGLEQCIEIKPSGGLSEDEVQDIIRRAEERKDEELHRKEIITLRNKLEGMIYTLDRTKSQYGKYLNETELKKVKEALHEAKKAVTTENEAKIQEALDKVVQMSRVLSEVVMFNPIPSATAAPPQEDKK